MKVLIQSFGYSKTGYPADKTGNGGGFIFDCRAIDAFDYSLGYGPNTPFPHTNLTGLDIEVADILDKDMDTQKFFEAVWSLVKLDIAKCLRRGFKVMTVNFGCTAGRHRSVYMAEQLAKKIKETFLKVEIELNHLERARWPKKS